MFKKEIQSKIKKLFKKKKLLRMKTISLFRNRKLLILNKIFKNYKLVKD